MGASGGPLSSVVTYDVAAGEVQRRAAGGDGGRARVDLRLPRSRAAPARHRRRRPAVRPDVRLRRLPRLRAQGGLRGRAPASLHAPRRRVRVRRPAHRVRPSRAVDLRRLPHRSRNRGGGRAVGRRGEPRSWTPCRRSRRSTSPTGGARTRPSSSGSAGRTTPTSPTSTACKDYLTEGESYEICLTNKVWTDATVDPLRLYRILRHINPAPFSALLRFGDAAVVSSSPERFLKIHRDGWVEAKPIKGTCSRGQDPEEDRRLTRAPADGREEPGREPDDHRPAAQRPRHRLRDRHRPRAASDGGRDLRDRAPARLDRRRSSARRTSARPPASARASPAAR